jgi:hypothetical protein
MVGAAARARALASPLAVVAEVVAGVDPALDPVVIGAAAEQVAASRHKRRRLALALLEDPAVLTDGRATSPAVVQQLVRALLERGATRLVVARCAECGRPQPLPARRGPAGICLSCYRRQARVSCSGCGRRAMAATRDRDGRPRCQRCPISDRADPLVGILAAVWQLAPTTAASTVTAAIGRAAPSVALQRRLAWALEGQPALLAGAGASGPAVALRLIEELLAAGVTGVVRPACPGCQRVVRLDGLRDGQRVCSACYARARAEPCSGCGATRAVTIRDAAGRPCCSVCAGRDPARQQVCARCGRPRTVVKRTADGPLCRSCWRGPTATCSCCGRQAPCTGIRAGRPRCERCARPRQPCVRCGRVLPVAARHHDGPWCVGCHRSRPRPCQGCGVEEPVVAEGCCAGCVLDRRVRVLLSGDDGGIRPQLRDLQQTLTATRPARAALKWLHNPSVQVVLRQFASGTRPVSHHALDELAGDRRVEHLRSVLVAGGCLPARDQALTRLERWTDQAVAGIQRPEQQRLIRAFAVWHLLRRLRRRVGDGQASLAQTNWLRTRIRAAIGLLDWLAAHDLTLATCRQADLDRWRAAGNHSTRHPAHEFIRWAVERRLAHNLEVPCHTWTGPAQPIDTTQRWQVARRLLTDTTLSPTDRVAGLLVLLYAQPVSMITRLTVDHVSSDDSGVRLQLGQAPILLPAPLDELVCTLVAARKGHATVGHQHASPWLFPGGRPGRPIGAQQLMHRLHRLGIRARPARTAALMQLATELPAVLLARLLGLHPNVAATWQRLSGGHWTGYATELSRRGNPTITPSPPP